MATVVHVTHEATHKIGGIGAVLEGLLTSHAYQNAIHRSILVGPWSLGTSPEERLGAAGSRILYSVCDGIDEGGWRRVFRPVEEAYQVWLTYGTRPFRDMATGATMDAEVLLVETSTLNAARYDYQKATYYQRFGIASGDYEHEPDYDLWMRIAEPAYGAVMAMTEDDDRPVTFIAHEYMGMPTALKAVMEDEEDVYTAFYAHEVATVRPHVEAHPGHDTRFYNAMAEARRHGLFIEDVLGDQWAAYRHALIDRAQFCDAVFAVGDRVVEEYEFLSPACAEAPISLVYNGIPSADITLASKQASKARLAQYCENLLGYTPDHVFTHVTRLVMSKGLWRDLRVLEHLDKHFDEAGRSGVLYVLSTEIGPGRPSDAARSMEAEYGWPAVHREGYPDLTGLEVDFYRSVVTFNAQSRAIKVVFVNQFGWSRDRCGARMPEDMEFMDIRKGSDVEFGMSVYEPFGIAQVEPLSFGAICLISNVCGCAGFVARATDGEDVPNVLVADYTDLGSGYTGVDGVTHIGWAERDAIERRNTVDVAKALYERLPTTDAESETMLKRGREIARGMSWDVVTEDYFLPGLARARESRA
ncbi:hypothetical protein HN371_23215 [Candidatus Poribacteria bacterium]|nr:hypothetical protein [Candidatus Poribacteria bacterium]MBT5537218.1 hypothetical protein [Candidatus Poribacteria bacterium]MBT7096229.1 hypothetical protein [Candidatus Poribacteria bacterium]MBT7808959.1 hypothetical protein [Candidatus Poribacteria bacterium]